MKVFGMLITKESMINFLYLVMVIVVVTMIKDMLVSMYQKRKEKQWLKNVFNKKEGFTTGGTITCPDPPNETTCDKLKYLLCNTNFEILKKYIEADLVNIYTINSVIKHGIDTKGANISTGTGDLHTAGGNIYTGVHSNGTFSNGGFIKTAGGDIYVDGGNISTDNRNTMPVGGGVASFNRIVVSGDQSSSTDNYSINVESGNIKLNTQENSEAAVVTNNIIIEGPELVFKNTNDESLYSFGSTFNNRVTIGGNPDCSPYPIFKRFDRNGEYTVPSGTNSGFMVYSGTTC